MSHSTLNTDNTLGETERTFNLLKTSLTGAISGTVSIAGSEKAQRTLSAS